jgi:hypothetical protein
VTILVERSLARSQVFNVALHSRVYVQTLCSGSMMVICPSLSRCKYARFALLCVR